LFRKAFRQVDRIFGFHVLAGHLGDAAAPEAVNGGARQEEATHGQEPPASTANRDRPSSVDQSPSEDVSEEPISMFDALREEDNAVPLVLDGMSRLPEEYMTRMLTDMDSSDCAFIVFESEAARDDAIEAVEEKNGIDFKGKTIYLEVKYCEPESARYGGLCYGTKKGHRMKRLVAGFWAVLWALTLWCCVIYLPYAYYLTSFSYANGDEPGALISQVFNLLVVIGNQLMYYLADLVSQHAGFCFEDDREVAYNIIYVFATVTNLLFDMLVTVYLAYKMMIGNGVHTSDGRLIEELHSVNEIFESYPVQKVFGDLLSEYSYPSCFVYPFICEALFAIAVPYFVTKYIVLSHDWVRNRDAELSMQYFLPMSLGRYGDILLNMILCTMVFFAPGGFTLPMFVAFFVSHAGLYAYDHWRILRVTPCFHYANQTVDKLAQLILMIPTGVLATCAVYRFSQMVAFAWMDGYFLWICCGVAFVGHCMMHVIVLKAVVPTLVTKVPHEPSKASYAEVATKTALTWFSTNPVHCLRSKFIHKHNPPHMMAIYGKEHLQQKNEDIGVHFEDTLHGGANMSGNKRSAEEKMAWMDHEDEQIERPRRGQEQSDGGWFSWFT
jgi:hypothetical protein